MSRQGQEDDDKQIDAFASDAYNVPHFIHFIQLAKRRWLPLPGLKDFG